VFKSFVKFKFDLIAQAHTQVLYISLMSFN